MTIQILDPYARSLTGRSESFARALVGLKTSQHPSNPLLAIMIFLAIWKSPV